MDYFEQTDQPGAELHSQPAGAILAPRDRKWEMKQGGRWAEQGLQGILRLREKDKKGRSRDVMDAVIIRWERHRCGQVAFVRFVLLRNTDLTSPIPQHKDKD